MAKHSEHDPDQDHHDPSKEDAAAAPPPPPASEAAPPPAPMESAAAGGLSRRAFLRGGAALGSGAALGVSAALGAGALGTALAVSGDAAAGAPAAPASAAARHEAGVELLGPGPLPMSFEINGRKLEAVLEPRVTLLDALRDHFELTGAKRVCDRGTCGACTIHVDGKPVYACSMLAVEARGHRVTTIESLGTPQHLHPLQAAIVEHDGHQCGFCTPGFVMAAKALLDHNPAPTLAEVHHGLSGNFCRCGTYAGLRAGVLEAAEHLAATAPAPARKGA